MRDAKTPPPPRLDDAGDLLLKGIQDRPDDVHAHVTFLTYCAEHNLVVEAARVYRDLLVKRDRRALEAQAILRMTQEARREQPPSRFPGTAVLLILLGALALAGPLFLTLCGRSQGLQ